MTLALGKTLFSGATCVSGPCDYSEAPVAELTRAAAESFSAGTRSWHRIDPYQVSRRDGLI